VVASVADLDGFIAAVDEHRPDVAAVDVRGGCPDAADDDRRRASGRGRGAATTLRARGVVLSAYIERSYVDVPLSDGRGRVGYLLKDRVASLDALVDALRTITAGGTVLDPEVVAQLLVARQADPLAALTPRERDVLRLMAEGRSNAALADALVITGGAVEAGVQHLCQDQSPRPRFGQPPRTRGLTWLKAR
jgi:DNA-binding NarL/FixJ family response regulator